MIVNPQFFSYKFIIGSLIVALVFVGVSSFNTYESNKRQQYFLEQENKLIESELSQMILRYDDLEHTSELISKQLDSAKKTTQSALNQLNLMKSDFSVFTRFKSELSAIKVKRTVLLNTIDSINLLNERLENEKQSAFIELSKQKEVNHSLKKTNTSLNNLIEKEAVLTANSFKAEAYPSGANAVSTTKASQTNQINVCFKLAENTLIEKGMKDIYIQILNPLNNVIAHKSAIKFGESLLVYSDKQRINYDNQVIDICSTIQAQKNDKPFAKGTYYISVFHKDRKLGGTQLELN